MAVVEAYPLHWPLGWKRTSDNRRKRGKFICTVATARDEVYSELRKLAARNIIVSSDVPLRKDGLMIGSDVRPDDPGVAVYFKLKDRDMCLACDQYDLLSHNLRAIAKTLDALRGIERWGASDMLERAFTGFMALPEVTSTPWREVLDFAIDESVTEESIAAKFRALAKQHHPDAGGSVETMQTVIKAKDQAVAFIRGLKP
jgi:hypothetical protein